MNLKKNHFSVNYVEPNDVNSLVLINPDGSKKIVERAPKLEDYCVVIGIEIELSHRSADFVIDGEDNKLTMIYKNGSEGKEKINFFKGTVFDASSSNASFLTTHYATLTSEEIKTYQTTEMLGIKSIDVEYDNFCIPQITIVFTDVRGMSLFQPSELDSELKKKGFAEINSKNVSQAFFRSFFMIPCPKFTIYIKGFYGEPVAYQMTCVDFRSSFDSENGNFDTTVKFVGYTFSFLTEISVNALMAAPYSDYEGEKYWKDQVANKRFMLPNKEGTELVSMPTLCELVTDIERVETESAVELAKSDLSSPLRDNSAEVEELSEIVMLYRNWYRTMFNAFDTIYKNSSIASTPGSVGSNEKAAQAISSDGEDYDFGVFYVPSEKKSTINSLKDAFNECSGQAAFKEAVIAHNDLRAKIESYNLSSSKTIDLNEVSEDLHEFTKEKFIKRIYYDESPSKPKYFSTQTSNFIVGEGGRYFAPVTTPPSNNSNIIYSFSKTLHSNSVFNKESLKTYPTLADEDVLSYGYNHRTEGGMPIDDGTSLDVIVVNLNYKNVIDRIKSLSTQYSDSDIEAAKSLQARLQRSLIMKKLCWHPSIENFTKIMMAHVETLMHMIFCAVKETKGRKASELGVAIGSIETSDSKYSCSDVTADSLTIPPFPRVTVSRVETGAGGETVEVKEDEWIGNLGTSKTFIEADLVNGLLNGANRVNDKIAMERAASDEVLRPTTSNTNGETCIIPYPLTSYDYFLEENPYGSNNDVSNNFALFASKIALRMYGILGINHYTVEFSSENKKFLTSENVEVLGSTEADNFYELNTIPNSSLLDAITSKSLTSDIIISIIEDNKTASAYKVNGTWPWGNGALFDSASFYPKFETEGGNLYPLQGFDFENINEVLSKYEQEKACFTENRNIVTPLLPPDAPMDILYYATTNTESYLNYDMVIDESFKINGFLNEGIAKSKNEKYKILYENIFNEIASNGITNESGETEGLGHTLASFFNQEGKSSFCATIEGLSNELDKKKRSNRIITDSIKDDLFALSDDGTQINYVHDRLSLKPYLIEEKLSKTINTVTLTEVFGINNPNTSLFTSLAYYDIKDNLDKNFNKKYIQAAFFIMGIYGFNYDKIAEYIKNRTHFYLPNVIALQMGAIFGAQYYLKKEKFTNDNDLLKIYNYPIPFPPNIGGLLKVINKFSKASKLQFLRNFMKWADDANINECLQNFELCHKENKLFSDEEVKKFSDGAERTAVTFGTIVSVDKAVNWCLRGDVHRAVFSNGNFGQESRVLFNQGNKYVRVMTSSLLHIVCVTKCHNFNDETDYDSTKRLKKGISKEHAKIYLDAFLSRLSDRINGVTEDTSSVSNLIRKTKDPNQITIDMKIALYLYLKQLYDKWIPSTTMEDWAFDKFFGNPDENGHKFYFIDSFYNKIGHRLLINPEILSTALEKSMQSPDWNAVALPFMSDIYAAHKCMFKCVQNFIDMTSKDSMENMFKPVSYYEMKKPKKNPDFIVIYPYQPSENLDMNNGQFENDGFMLNDSALSPSAIAKRTMPTDKKESDEWYQLPAFGVVYGGQYQSYFKKIDVNMDNPIATEQSIGAKYRIAAMYRTDSKKGLVTTAQDIYDIYSTRSYTCKIQMMGCAWVQPLMYFVLLNVPLFKGSYIIMKVSHKLTPGNMETEITGCRMSRISTRLVEDIFTDEVGGDMGNSIENYKHILADSSNNCEYQEFPMYEVSGDVKKMTESQLKLACKMVKYLTDRNYFNEIPAIASVGNMMRESGLVPTTANTNDRGYISGSLCQWRAGNLICLIENKPDQFWCIDYSAATDTKSNAKNIEKWERLLKSITTERALDFYYESITNKKNRYPNSRYGDFNSKTNLDEAAEWWYDYYGVGYGSLADKNADAAARKYRENEVSIRKGYANQISYYLENGTPLINDSDSKKKKGNDKEDFCRRYMNAIKKSFAKANGDKVTTKIGENAAGNPFIIFSNSKQLHKIFDIALTTYYEYTFYVQWVYDSNFKTDEPVEVRITPKETINEKRCIDIIDTNKIESVDVPKECCGKLVQTLVKVYGKGPKVNSSDDLKKLTTVNGEYISAIQDLINNTAIKDCNDLLASLPSLTNNAFGTIAPIKGLDTVKNEKMKVLLDVVNGGYALNFIESQNFPGHYKDGHGSHSGRGHYPPSCMFGKGKGKDGKDESEANYKGWQIDKESYFSCCTSGPKTWYKRVGINLVWWNPKGETNSKYEFTKKNMENAKLDGEGMKLVWHGNITNCKGNTVVGGTAAPGFEIKPGDVATMHVRTSGGRSTSHGLMWTGSDWRSDAIQSKMSCYGTNATGRDGDYSVCIWRHPKLQNNGEWKDSDEVT